MKFSIRIVLLILINVFSISTAFAVGDKDNIVIKSVNYNETDISSEISVIFSGPITYEWHRLKSSDGRFYIDFKEVVLTKNKLTFPSMDKILSNMKIAQFQIKPPIVRMVFKLNKMVDVKISEDKKEPYKLVITMGNNEVDENGISLAGEGNIGQPVDENPKDATSNANDNHKLRFYGDAFSKTIVIDPGHGGGDGGAVNNDLGLLEKEITLDIALRLEKILTQEGWNVVLTRSTDRDVTYEGSSDKEELEARVNIGNKSDAFVFISIHCDASSNKEPSGTTTFFHKDIDELLAMELQNSLISSLGTRNRGIKKAKFYLLKGVKFPSVLIEVGFISNSGDAKLLGSSEFRQKVAISIYNGIENYKDKIIPGEK